MLSLGLNPGDYLTIGDGIVVQVARIAEGRAYLAIDAPREIPIQRGAVRERQGKGRPAAARLPRPKHEEYWDYKT